MLKEKIEQDKKEAILKNDLNKKNTLRNISTEITKHEKSKENAVATDEVVEKIIKQLAKQRTDAAELYRKGERIELAEIEEAELEILKSYLPKELDETQTKAIVDKIVAENPNPKSPGLLIGLIMREAKGAANPKIVNKLLMECLQN